MSGAYDRLLDSTLGVLLHVEFTTVRREVVSYSVVLTVRHEGAARTVRVYDAAHGVSEMHRHTLTGGKEPAEVVHRGTLGEGLRAAIEACVHGYGEMIEGWRR